MLSTALYGDLGRLIRILSLLSRRVEEGAQTPEVELHVDTAVQTLGRVASKIRRPDATPVQQLKRHLHWIVYYHSRDQHDRYQGDIEDITQRDLPGVIDLVNQWEGELLFPGLIDAVSESWAQGNYANAARDAFIYLEDALRSTGNVSRAEGLSADQLVNRLLRPDSPDRVDLAGSPQAPRTEGEQQGAMLFLKGAFLLFRNAVSHRFVPYTPEQADELLRVVNLCLRVLGTEDQPVMRLRLQSRVSDEDAGRLNPSASEPLTQSRKELSSI